MVFLRVLILVPFSPSVTWYIFSTPLCILLGSLLRLGLIVKTPEPVPDEVP